MSDVTLERVLAIIRNVDKWLDAEVSAGYQGQPLAQDWARVAKVTEEVGEAIDALIGCTGQNPRKGHYGTADDLLGELGDVVVTGMFAIQHFTKDEQRTATVVMKALEKAAGRAAEAGYGDAGQEAESRLEEHGRDDDDIIKDAASLADWDIIAEGDGDE